MVLHQAKSELVGPVQVTASGSFFVPRDFVLLGFPDPMTSFVIESQGESTSLLSVLRMQTLSRYRLPL